MVVGRKIVSMLKSSNKSNTAATMEVETMKAVKISKVLSGLLICLTGGFALSALDDLLIYTGCTNKAIEKASKNRRVIEAIGEPIVRGPWYNASLAVAHKRQSVSCTFPVSGPQGTGLFQLKAVRSGDDTWFSILRSRDWEILVMEALLHVPGNENKEQTFRISVSDNPLPQHANNSFTTQPSESAQNIQSQASGITT